MEYLPSHSEHVRPHQEKEAVNHPRNAVFHLPAYRRTVLSPQQTDRSQGVTFGLVSIKLGNLLINSKMELKLADFGLATKIEYQGDRKHTVCGTPNYIAPEVILSSMGMGVSGHSYEVDIWSTGVIMYLMLVGKAPFETNRVEKTYERISRADFDFPDYFKDPSAKDLLRKILVVDPSKRFTFEQILSHDFMNPKNGIPK
jgi:polo-like kinase 1